MKLRQHGGVSISPVRTPADLSGTVHNRVTSSLLQFLVAGAGARKKRGYVVAYLRECDASGSSCSTIATESVNRRRWHRRLNQWMEDTITFQGLSHTVPNGHYLEVKLVVHSNADDDMWFAYDTVDYPARLFLP